MYYILEVYTPYRKIETKHNSYREGMKAYIKCRLKVEEYKRKNPQAKCSCMLHECEENKEFFDLFKDFKLFCHLDNVKEKYIAFCKYYSK